MRRTLVKIVLGSLFGIFWAALIAEIGLRVMMAQAMIPDRAPADIFAAHPIGWTLEPNIDAHIVSQNGMITIHSNAQGFRDQAYPNQADGQRFLLLGDSYTLALETRTEDTFHVKLETKLQQEVISLGVSGYGLTQYLLSYEKIGRNYQPTDVLVMLYTGNDLVSTAPIEDMPYYALESDQLILKKYPYRGEFDLPLVTTQRSTPLMRRSALAFVIGLFTRRPPALASESGDADAYCDYWSRSNYPNPTPEEWTRMEAHLIALRDIVQADGGSLRVAIIPTEYRVEPDDVQAFLAAGCTIPDHAQPAIEDEVIDLLIRLEIPYLDLLPGLLAARGDQQMYLPGNDIHWTAAGHDAVANTLFDWLKG